eukprot:TRINITY_DN5177_c0_g1_i2.p1 TRINITY_DN5177_c0_g1~~TRINITY_DN5177_c0_g1_i2.p1  ORF type:complete len:613 (+),score=95.36 TRINITY_DN5177_c0_g1_i2:199-2037(+)
MSSKEEEKSLTDLLSQKYDAIHPIMDKIKFVSEGTELHKRLIKLVEAALQKEKEEASSAVPYWKKLEEEMPSSTGAGNSSQDIRLVRNGRPLWWGINEGIDLFGEVVTQRRHLIDTIFQRTNNLTPVLLVDSPPYSGKTSTIQLLNSALDKNGFKWKSLTWVIPGLSADDRWTNVVKNFWNTIEDGDWVTMDECQISYLLTGGRELEGHLIGPQVPLHEFWESIKLLLQKKNFYLVLFASHRGEVQRSGEYSTPVALSNRLGPQEVRMSNEDSNELWESYQNAGSKISSFNKELYDQLVETTNGHVGMTRFMLGKCVEKFRYTLNLQDVAPDKILEFISSSEMLLEFTTSTRAVPKPSCLSNVEQDAIKTILRDGSIDYSDSLKNLERLGICTHNSNTLSMFSPWLESCYKRLIYSNNTFQFKYLNPSKPEAMPFLKEMVSRMNPRRIIDNFSVTVQTNTPLESVWSSELYRAACTISKSVSPQFGPTLGINGFLDWYINSTFCIGVQVMRDDINIKGHLEKLITNNYAQLPKSQNAKGVVSEILFVDFRYAHLQNSKDGYPNQIFEGVHYVDLDLNTCQFTINQYRQHKINGKMEVFQLSPELVEQCPECY